MVHVVLGPLNFDVSNDAAFGAVVAVVVVPLTGVVMGRLTGFWRKRSRPRARARLTYVGTDIRHGEIHPVGYIIRNTGADTALCARYCRFERYAVKGPGDGSSTNWDQWLGSDSFDLEGNESGAIQCDTEASWARQVLEDIAPALGSTARTDSSAAAIVWKDRSGSSFRHNYPAETLESWKMRWWIPCKVTPPWTHWPE